MPITSELLSRFRTDLFVETGSFCGDGIQAALDAGFPRVVSCEIAEWNYNYSLRRFQDDKRVKLFHGDSARFMPIMILGEKVRMTFWLDGHYHEGNKPEGKPLTPLLDELKIIKQHQRKDHIILIDDMRLWRDPSGTHGLTEKQIIEAVKAINPKYEISYHRGFADNDILAATPA